MTLRIERVTTPGLTPAVFADIIELCDQAFAESTGPYFAAIGAGEHLLAWRDQILVSHLMWVTRWLQPAGFRPLRTAYLEMVATARDFQHQGLATRLVEQIPSLAADFEVAALSPATESVYQRLGWKYWRGPLSARRGGDLTRSPDDRVMLLPLSQTPSDLDWDSGLSIEWRAGEVW